MIGGYSMRIIHSRKKVFNKDFAFENSFTLLVWILSILKWKEYKNEIVLYTDDETLEKIKAYGFDTLYDEINTEYLSDTNNFLDIDLYYFWAMPKLLAYKHEALDLNNDVVIADTDVVPMSNISRFWYNCDVAVWSNKEFVEFKSIYPNLKDLPLPDNYILPKWYSGTAKPLNTGIIHIKNTEIIKQYLEEALKMSTKVDCTGYSMVVPMCNAEQRTLGEIVNHNKLSLQVVQPINKGLFNKNAFHTHGYKRNLSGKRKVQFNCNLLMMIKDLDKELYLKLIEKDMFDSERKMLIENNYNVPYVKELQQYL